MNFSLNLQSLEDLVSRSMLPKSSIPISQSRYKLIFAPGNVFIFQKFLVTSMAVTTSKKNNCLSLSDDFAGTTNVWLSHLLTLSGRRLHLRINVQCLIGREDPIPLESVM